MDLPVLKNASWPGSQTFSVTDLWPKTCTPFLFASVFLVSSSVPENLSSEGDLFWFYPYKAAVAKVMPCPSPPHHKLFLGAVPVILAKLLYQEVGVLDWAICHFGARVTAGALHCFLLLTLIARWLSSMLEYYFKKNALQPKNPTYRTWSPL